MALSRRSGGRSIVACVLVLVACGVAPALAAAHDPGRWYLTGHSPIKFEYYQGITSDPTNALFFDGVFVGLYRTTATLAEKARTLNVIPADVTSREGYNHIGDLTWDAAEGGRLLLPLECYLPGAPNGPNTCKTASIGVADPVTLRWRYYVKLDPADIPKAMWAEVSPDGTLVWTSAGRDLLAYRTADITAANAAPGGPLIRPVARLTGAVPPSGITGATFWRGRLFVAGQGTGSFQVWSIDVTNGARRLEIERDIHGESEGLDVFDALGGVLHWQVEPRSAIPTYGFGRGALLHFVPAGRLRIRLAVSPRRVVAGVRRRFSFRATVRVDRRNKAVAGARLRFAGRVAKTDRRGRARIVARLRSPATYRVRATATALRAGSAAVRARGR